MTNCIDTQTALLRYIIKYARIEKRPYISLHSFADRYAGELFYTLYVESSTKTDKSKIKNILKEAFDLNEDLIKQDDWVTSYLLDTDKYLNLVAVLKMNGEMTNG